MSKNMLGCVAYLYTVTQSILADLLFIIQVTVEGKKRLVSISRDIYHRASCVMLLIHDRQPKKEKGDHVILCSAHELQTIRLEHTIV